MKNCVFCGEEVDPRDYDIGPRGNRIYLCSKSECNREHQQVIHEMYEEERERLSEDYFGR